MMRAILAVLFLLFAAPVALTQEAVTPPASAQKEEATLDETERLTLDNLRLSARAAELEIALAQTRLNNIQTQFNAYVSKLKEKYPGMELAVDNTTGQITLKRPSPPES